MLTITLLAGFGIGIGSFFLGLYVAYLAVACSYREEEKAIDATEYDEFLPTAFINEN